MPSFASASVLTALHGAAVSSNSNSAGVDISSYNGEVLVNLATGNTAGTNPTLAVKLQDTPNTNVVSNVAASTNTGTGTLTEVEGGADAVAETFTLTASNATTFAVSGSVSGSLGNATVGTKFIHAKVAFLLTAGGTAFAGSDSFTFDVAARTYADVDGGGFTSLTTGASGQKLAINTDKLGRWVRLNFVIGGTVSPAYQVVSNVIGCK